MNKNDKHVETVGMLYTFFAFLMWAFLALYWNALQSVSSTEILAHRICWAFVFMITILCLKKNKLSLFYANFKTLIFTPRLLFLVICSSLAISANWVIYIWAVNHERVVEASLGLYITPLVSILFGMIFLKDRTNLLQIIAISMAAFGVLILTLKYGHVPWIALSLALTSGIYSLSKKFIHFDSVIGMTFETLMVMPFALMYLIYLHGKGISAFGAGPIHITLLLIGAGVVTALPLIWFAEGAKRITLTMIGFFQYITPSVTFILGIFVFKESVIFIQWISFLFIWAALLVFTLSKTKLTTIVRISDKKEA
ncbi:EamA family transporter RarD [Bacillus sp. 03113]|uniref:EamA family transporter RarD n=1 Tax=Bacillus sp. 03113 TaxID=2578211 RepID=UPI0011418662|nr:EamA family transporter RarD [Bacillus sp. 03113]